MIWTADAKAIVQMAPMLVRPMIRRQVESLAAKQGIRQITGEFLMQAKAHRDAMRAGVAASPPSSSPLPPLPASPIDLGSYRANPSDDPLTQAFAANDDVHVMPMGQVLTSVRADAAWRQARQNPPVAGSPCVLYLHVPFCRSRCVFCPFYANRWNDAACHGYAEALVREIEHLGDTPLAQTPIDAVYFGGGTPSDLAPTDLTRILKSLTGRLTLAENAEITLEGRIWKFEQPLIDAAIQGGVNRFSLGVQTFDTNLRRSLGRQANRQQIIDRLNQMTQTPAAVIIDLIFGLPGQTLEHWKEDLRCVSRETAVHGADLYRLKSVPGAVMDDLVRSGRLSLPADLKLSASMFATGVETMQALGWQRLSHAHWRRDAKERSEYNRLVKAGHDCIPVGCGASGRLGLKRFFQTGELSHYLTRVQRGEKPISSAMDLPATSAITDRIASDLELGRLKPGGWPIADERVHASMQVLLTQWSQAGLLSALPDGDWDLTLAGQFWNVTMGMRLSHLAQT